MVRGAIFDVVFDIRIGSPTFGQHVSRILSAKNREQLWISVDFAHGFSTLELYTEVINNVTDFYALKRNGRILQNGVALNIAWPLASGEAILSAEDQSHPLLSELSKVSSYWTVAKKNT